MARRIEFEQILQDEASFQLVRTNPKLTGNVKLTIDSNDRMWLDSIDANEELSKSIYKKFPIDVSMSLPGNIFSFFNSGNTPSEIVFDLSESFDSTKTSTDFKDQYDFSNYFSGVKYLTSRRYTEKLSYFAPIFLKKDVPEYFVIFKINDPLNSNIKDMKDSYPIDRESYIKDIFKNSTIIKTFDLRATTKIGKYIRDYINDSNFPDTPLEVTYDEDSLTNFNGILYNAGVFGKRGEILYDFYQSSNPLKFFEEFITLGFERNGVILPNILNIDFIFDDDTSNIYDFNRYIGMYVNAIELSELNVDLDRAYNERATWENSPRFRREYYEYENVNLIQENENGVVIPVTDLSVYLSDFKDIFKDKDNMFFNYITDRDNNIYLPKLNDPYNIDYFEGDELFSSKLRLSNTKIDLGRFFGPSSTYIQDSGESTLIRGASHSYIKIDSINHLDQIKIYYPNGSRSDVNGRYELLEGVSGYNPLPNPGDYYVYIDIDNITGYNKYYFNIDGSKEEIARSISGCLNNLNNVGLRSHSINEYVFIKSTVFGEYDKLYSLQFNSIQSIYDGITINDITGSNLINTIIPFQGGSKESGNRIIIDSLHFNKINLKLNEILVKTQDGWSKIRKISKYIDVINDANLKSKETKSQAISDFLGKLVVTLDLDTKPELNYNEFIMKLAHRPEFGLLSFFPIKDFDFDFYSSEYLNFPENDLFEHYYIPPNVNRLYPNVQYIMYGAGTIEVLENTPISYASPGTFTIASTSGEFKYNVTSGDVIVTRLPLPTSLSTGDDLWNPVNDQNEELTEFPGFFLLKDPDQVIPERDDKLFELRDKYLNGIARSEYDYYKENSSADFALKSKMIPYISKWVIPDGNDARSNPYRLNTELVFGFNNFSPNHEDRSQNSSNFTHEWYYIESKFSYVDTPETIKLNNSYFEYPFDLNRAVTEEGYFIDYFTYTPTFNGREIGKTQTRYSPINKNNIGVYESFFKGFKINFKDYIDINNINEAGKPEFDPNSNRFEDYKFSCLLKVVKEDINDDSIPPIRYRFIEQKDFKFVLLLIEISIGSQDSIEDYWKEVRSLGDRFDSVSNELSSPPFNINFLDTLPIYSTQAYNSINGDYRIKFDVVDNLDISNITHTLLYSLKHKKFNNLENNFSNIRLSTKLILNSTGAFNSDNNIDALPNENYLNYPYSLSDEITSANPKTFVIGRDNFNNVDRFIDSITGFTPNHVSKMSGASDKFITYSTSIGNGLVDAATNLLISFIPSGISNIFTQKNYTFKIMSGGELYFETLLEKISFGSFKELVNQQSNFIEYTTYSYSENNLTVEDSKWYSEIPDVSIVTKTDAIVAQIDNTKPSNLSFKNLIGFKYERTKLDNSYEMNRYSGGFSPLFKDLFTFNSKFNFNKNDIEALDLSNTKFNIEVDDFLKISNFSHIKIANTKILDLESDEEFDPKYEIVNEIAIGRSQYDLLSSNWDFGFHHLYTDKSANVPVPGSLRIEEDYSFLAKVIKLRDEIELEQFKIEKVKNVELVNLDNYEIVYQENDTTITGKINVKNVLTSYLISDGILNKFNEFLVNDHTFIGNYENIEKYAVAYIEANISKLYEITTTEFYSKFDRSILEESNVNSNINAIEFRILDDKERADQGYKLDRNLRINKLDRFILNFEFIKTLNSGVLISPKIKINFI